MRNLELLSKGKAEHLAQFVPSIYSAVKSATTTVSGQSEAIATGATKIEVVNNDASLTLTIGLGMSTTEAEQACSTGIAGENKFLLLPKGRLFYHLSDYSHYAWLGVGGIVSTQITQGI